MSKENAADPDLIDLKRRILTAMRSGDIEEASDTLLEVWAHHGILRGDMQALDRFAVGSGLVGGLKDRKRIAGVMANKMSRMIEKEQETGDEPDYESRLSK